MRAPDGGKEEEADITINGEALTFAQSMTVRMAVSTFLLHLRDEDFAKSLGRVGDNYRDRLREVEALIMRSAR